MAMVTLTDVMKIYRMGTVEVPALRGVSLTIEAGGFAAIMGPSGCGKSTLLDILGCLDRPTSGSVAINGMEVAKMSKAELATMRNQKIGFIFQNFHLLHQLPALANVMLPFLYSHVPKGQRRDRAMELLRLVGLEGRAFHKPFELSGRPTTARRHRTRPRQPSEADSGGRAHRQSGLPVGARDHGAAGALEQRRHDHSDGDA